MMKRSSSQVILAVAVCVVALFGVAGSAVAARPEPVLTATSAHYYAGTSGADTVQMTGLSWTHVRPAYVGVMVLDKDFIQIDTLYTTYVLKGADGKYPQDFAAAGLIADLTMGQTYYLKGVLTDREQVTITGTALWGPFTAGTDWTSP